MKNDRLPLHALLISFLVLLAPCSAAPAQTNSKAPARPALEMPEVVAEINGEKIMKNDLTAECVRIHGENELRDQIKKFLIQLECSRLNVSVSKKEIDEEIVRMAKTFSFSSEEWLEILQRERNISAEQYMSDIIWPILAIRKLAGRQMQITEEEIQREFDSRFGPAVQVRQIVLKSRADAEQVLAEVRANPDSFASVAKNRSLDSASQPYGGLVHPIRRNTLRNPEIETMLFSMKNGEISPIVEWPPGEFILFRCEQHLAPQNVDKDVYREQLVMKIRDVKTRDVADRIFGELQDRARIEIVYGDPARMARTPGVAAVVNGQTLGMKFLSDVCLKRYGEQVLSDMINKTMIEQACRKQNAVITEADIDAEIRETAIKHIPLRSDGSPNVDLLMKLATQESRVSPQVYRTNTVWPVLALKRLSRPMVRITEDDLQRSFEANFGRKVRCLAIMFNQKDQKRAQDVWAEANKRRTPEHFGDLAEKHSVDAESRVARGIIPSIGKYGGQPILEKEAFGLLPNEISQIVQVDDHLVILYCLGFEEPTITDINDVKADLTADLFEKKQRLAVERYYENLMAQTAFDNYLTGESRNPQVEKAIRESGIAAPTQATGSPGPRK